MLSYNEAKQEVVLRRGLMLTELLCKHDLLLTFAAMYYFLKHMLKGMMPNQAVLLIVGKMHHYNVYILSRTLLKGILPLLGVVTAHIIKL